MEDALHLYPPLASLLWLWGVGIFTQVVAQMAWWALPRSPLRANGRSTLFLRRYLPKCWRGQKRNQRAVKLQPDTSVDEEEVVCTKPLSPVHLRVATRTEMEHLPAAALVVEETYTICKRIEPDQMLRSRSFYWKRLALRSALLTILVGVTSAVTNTVMLYMRTGRYVQQPYDWYSVVATGDRFFSNNLKLPEHLPSTCTFRNASGSQTTMLTLDQVISKYQTVSGSSPSALTKVFVVPFFWDHVVELRADQVLPVRSSRSSDSSSSPPSYENARPVDDISLFPYLWHSILGPHFDKRVASSQDKSPWLRRVEPLNLEFEIVRSSEQLKLLPHGTNLLVVTQSIYIIGSMFDMQPSMLPPDAKVGFLSLAREDCHNLEPHKYLNNTQIKFGFFPYGDCSFVDADRFNIIPLGPSFEHGFPTNAHLVDGPSLESKKFLLNLMVSWTVEKPTRIQAAIAALDVCSKKEHSSNSKLCIIEHNDMMFKALQYMDDQAGTNLRWLLSSAPDAYITNLKQSIFTLCPLGKNPEQYRIWEALAAGSIPIVEELPPAISLPGTFFHPSYPMSWKCMPEDMHGILKRLNAPVLFVSDWKRDLPRLLDELTTSDLSRPSGVAATAKLAELHARVRPWYAQLGAHLQAQVLDQTMRQFSSL